MEQYHELLKNILGNGRVSFEPRTKEYILGISGDQKVYDLRKGFPLMTTKNVPPRLPFEELFWKLRGERNVKSLVDKNVNIWTANAFDRYLKTNRLNEKIPKHTQIWNEEYEKYSKKIKDDAEFAKIAGDLGPVYGYQWRHWKFGKDLSDFVEKIKNELRINIFERIPELKNNKNFFVAEEVDQLENVIKGIKQTPGSRYHVLSAWNVSRLKEMALGPCPFWHQFSIWGEYLDLHMVQRSNDIFLGVPFNIAQDSALAHLVAHETGYTPRFFIHTTINTHAYLGVPPRANFWTDKDNVKKFQNNFNSIKKNEDYLDLKEWYIKNSPEESEGNEKKDHIPFILEQLSKEPTELPSLKIVKDKPLLDLINLPAMDVFKVENYYPYKWDSKANMAA